MSNHSYNPNLVPDNSVTVTKPRTNSYSIVTASISRETGKAYLIEVTNAEGEEVEVWIPKSTVQSMNARASTMTVADWILEQKGII